MKRLSADDFDFATVDKHRLDAELEVQVQRVLQHGVMLASAEEEFALAENNRKVVWASTDRDVRAFPENFGIKKLTEPAVENTVLLQTEYQAAVKAAVDAQYNLTILKQAQRALEHRKSVLEDLVKLHLAGYFSKVKLPEADRECLSEGTKQEVRRRGQVSYRRGGDE